MKDRTFLTNNHPTDGVSDIFLEFIEALVEEVVINGEPFDAQKKWLCKHSEAEDLNYETIESNLTDLFEAVKELEGHESKSGERLIGFLAKECYLSEDLVNKLIDKAAAVRAQKETEKKAQEEREQKAREEAERQAREERDRMAKEKARLQEKLDAERKAKEEAERKAREEAEHQEKIKKAEALFQQWANYYPPGTACDYQMSEKKIPLLMESAALGYPKAQNYLSQAFRFGLGIKRDLKEAFKLAMASALQDNPGGQLSVGVEYLYGGEVEPNDELAFLWINKSAQAGNPDGMIYLAICYQNGIGITRNLGYANKLISQAKEMAPKKANYFSRLIDCVTDEYIKSHRKSYYENHK